MNSSMLYKAQQRRSEDSLGSEEFSTGRISCKNQQHNDNDKRNDDLPLQKTCPSNEIHLAQKVLQEARSRRISTKFASLSSATEEGGKTRIRNLAAFDSLPQLHKIYDSKRETNNEHTHDESSRTSRECETITSLMEELKFHHGVIESYYQQTAKSNSSTEDGQHAAHVKGHKINNLIEDFLHSYDEVVNMTGNSSRRSSRSSRSSSRRSKEGRKLRRKEQSYFIPYEIEIPGSSDSLVRLPLEVSQSKKHEKRKVRFDLSSITYSCDQNDNRPIRNSIVRGWHQQLRARKTKTKGTIQGILRKSGQSCTITSDYNCN